MALSDQRSAPVVVDLTIDSDSDSDDDVAFSHTATVTSKAVSVPLPPHTRASKTSTPSARPANSPIPSLGSTSEVEPKLPVDTELNDNRSSVRTPAPASSSKSATPTTAPYTWLAAYTPKSCARAQTPTTSTTNAPRDAAQGSKRRKLSTPSRQEIGQDGVQTQSSAQIDRKQPSKHDATTSMPSQIASTTIRNTYSSQNLGAANGVHSVQYMNAALKPSGSSTPSLKALAKGPRPYVIGRLPQGDATIGPLNSGLTTPDSASATVIDLDSLDDGEMEIVQPTPPAAHKSRDASVVEQKRHDNVEYQGTSNGNTSATTVEARQALRSSMRPNPAPTVDGIGDEDRNSVASQLPVRPSTLHSTQQSKISSQMPTSVLPPTPASTNLHMKTNASTPREKADHLLIFLKEVKRLKWSDITEEFAKDIPGHNYANLQSRYSQTVNKRDRTKDPAILNLPPRFAAEARIDWLTVHTNLPTPKVRTEVADLGPRGTSDRHQNTGPRAIKQTRDYDDSSGTDSAPQRQRSRRAARVNYTWPSQRSREGEMGEFDGEGSAVGLSPNVTRSESPTNRTLMVTDASTAVQAKPLDMNCHSKDAQLGLSLHRDLRSPPQEFVPYLSSSHRLVMRTESGGWTWDQQSMQDFQGVVLHVDFSPAELQTVENIIAKTIPPRRPTRHSTYRRHLRSLLKDASEGRMQKLALEICKYLFSRDVQSVRAFLDDAAAGVVSDTPHVQRLAGVKPNSHLSSTPKASIEHIVRQRELGLQSRRGWQAASNPLTYRMKNQLIDTLGPKSTWTGASGDIHTVAWSPDGQYFAAGAVAVTDANSMQYNRPNVLMYGDTTNCNIHDLGAHHIRRSKTETGANSTHAMYASQDPMLYTTVSSVAFSPSGRLMYSASYDQSACIWDVTTGSEKPEMIKKLNHRAPVDVLAVNHKFDGMIATAAKRTTGKSIKLVHFDEETVDVSEPDWQRTIMNFASAKAMKRPDLKMSPSALKFDPTGQLLCAGFGANVREDSGLDTSGDICLWDLYTQQDIQIHGSSRNVFDLTFNPNARTQGMFAVGCVANGSVNRGTRSVVRFYNPKGSFNKFTSCLELECTAFDMNDVVWCPYDENLFAAGCTDGCSYVWDLRRPDRLLYTLGHGSSLMPLQDDAPHERTDTGVRFLSWGQNATRLYSGSSDGVVKVWDVTRSSQDAFVKDLVTANSGIMSGAFNPDYSKIVIGEVKGTAIVLEVGRDDVPLNDADKFQYHTYYDNSDEENATLPPEHTDTASDEESDWLESGQLLIAPMEGLPRRQVIQGPNYKGPFDRSEDVYTKTLRHQAFLSQQNMATIKESQCQLPGCAESIDLTTLEETGDSRRSKDRIPDELRRQWLDETARTVPGKRKCADCNRPALPPADSDDVPLCERCSFTCFRCGGESYIFGVTATLECGSCGGQWDIGALGYECSREPGGFASSLNVPALKRFGKESYLERLEDVETTFGDEMNAITDYYFDGH